MLIYSMGVSVDGFIADREGAFLLVGAQRGPVRFSSRADTRARLLSVGPQALRDDAGVGDRSIAARQRGHGRLRRRLGRAPEGRLQPHARRCPGHARLAEAPLAEEVAAALEA